MSSDATPKVRKHLTHRRERQQTEVTRFDDVDASPADLLPASDPDSFIEPVTKADPTASRQPSRQREPPRIRGP